MKRTRVLSSRTLISMLLAICLVFGTASLVAAAHDNHHKGQRSGNGNWEKYNGRNAVQFGFKDVTSSSWASKYINKMQLKNVFQGYEDGTFRPDHSVSRLEAIVMAVRLMDLKEEAEEISRSTNLHFKDAHKIPDWGYGYVVVALENGLFDSTADEIKPDTSASRLWIVNLLVRAMGLEDEALSRMTEIPDFKDANAIPAGSIGYVNVALDHDLLTGYPDHTFRPHVKVSRAEMAAFLDRMNDDFLDENGAYIVQGQIVKISDKPSVPGDVYGDNHGMITIKTFDGATSDYVISFDLLVEYYDRYIRADQLIAGDWLSLIVQDGKILEAAFAEEHEVVEIISHISELKVEIELEDDSEFKIKYKKNRKRTSGEIKIETRNDREKIKGEQAIAQIEEWIQRMALTPSMSKQVIYNKVVDLFQLDSRDVDELEIKIKFTNGKKIEIKDK